MKADRSREMHRSLEAQHGHAVARACRALWIVGALLLIPAPSRANDPSVTVDDAQDACGVQGEFRAPVSGVTAWQVLTDYDHIARFVSSVRSSRVERRDEHGLLLRQDAVGGFFLFHRRVQVLLDVRETPGSRIAFHDVLNKDFRSYVGEWRIATDSSETRVNYELRAEPRTPMPRGFCRVMLRRVARDLLQQVRAEMVRRASGTAAPRED